MKSKSYSRIVLAAYILSTSSVGAAERFVTSISTDPNTVGTLPYWLLNAGSGDTIDCSLISGQQITLTSSLPAIAQDFTIHGAGITIDGASSYQAFQVASGNLFIDNLTIQNSLSKGGQGGDGFSGGGGAVGGGGALYIHGDASVTLATSSLLNNVAQGGDGGAGSLYGNAGAGGGGGFGGGDGGGGFNQVTTGGGGGGHSNGGRGGSQYNENGSDGLFLGGGGGGAGINFVNLGGSGGSANGFVGGAPFLGNGGGGAGDSEDGVSATDIFPGSGGSGIGADLLFGGGGGGGASSETGALGGLGIGAAGGGGAANYGGGDGGILGGGGGGGSGAPGGGRGGFGAGGGGAVIGGLGGGGYGAGGGNGGSDINGIAGGGGGSGLGGAIFIQSGASLTLVDVASISGNTAIAGIGGSSTNSFDPGYIPAGDGAAMGYDIFIREEGSIIFDLSNTLTIATPIQGDQTTGPNTSGGLQKVGQGRLNLTGANTYSGITNVAGGTLNLNGSVIGNALVESGGRLSGNATILGDLTNSGILAPGNSIGTITTTNLILNPSSGLEIEVASDGTNDLIAATGTALIDGSLEVIPLPGSFQSIESYTILTATGGRTGIFSKVGSSRPALIKVIYDSNAVILEVLPISPLVLGSNAAAAAVCYLGDGFVPGSDREAVNDALLTLDIKGISDGFNQMQPSQFSGLAWAQLQNAFLVRATYTQHRESAPCSQIWGEVLGNWQKQNSSGQQFGYANWTGGATMGWDLLCYPELRLGVAASYTHSNLEWSRSVGQAFANSYYGGLYASWLRGIGYVNATLLGAYSHNKTHRHLHFATIDRHATASHNSWEGLAGIEAGLCFYRLSPFMRFDYLYLSRQGFLEQGAKSLDLYVYRHHDQILQSELGLNWASSYCSPSGTLLPFAKLSYINDAPIGCRHLQASFIDSDCIFTVEGLSFLRNQGAASFGLTYLNCSNTLSITVRYDGQFGRDYVCQTANIALAVRF